MATNYEKTKGLNELFGKETNCAIDNDSVFLQLGLIHEELRELEEAIEHGDRKNLRKELCDLLVVAYGLGYVMGFDVDRDFDFVHKSNMSKIVRSKDELSRNIKHYSKQGLRVHSVQTTPTTWAIVSSEDQSIGDKFFPAGKRLKPVDYKDWEEV